MTDDLPFLPGDPDPSRPERPARRCYRHEWATGSLLADPDAMCPNCVTPWKCNGPHVTTWSVCGRCGKVRDEAVAIRNKRNRKRGSSFERTVAKQLGGRRTGPLGGRDDVMVGEMFSIQTKRAQQFSLNEARSYLDDLRRTYPTRTPIVVHALPGERGGVVVLSLADWALLHGSDGRENP